MIKRRFVKNQHLYVTLCSYYKKKACKILKMPLSYLYLSEINVLPYCGKLWLAEAIS